MSHRALLAAAGVQGKLYVEDVFSAYPYAGTGGALTITNGINLVGNGGMIWAKERDTANSNVLSDTVQGYSVGLYTDSTGATGGSGGLTGFTSTGHTLGNSSLRNGSGSTYASWTFRRATKFFDVVIWTGDGTTNRQIPHALGIAPGMVTAKRRDSTGDWAVWHRSATGDLYLDTTAAQTGSFTQITATSATTFSVSGNANISGATYVAYVWAHDPDTVNGIVQCGLFNGGGVSVTLGWEPQYLLIKSANTANTGWFLLDAARGLSLGASNPYLFANTSAAEAASASVGTFVPSATGFSIGAWLDNSAGDTFIYLAIRRGPMRTPTSGTSVYNAIARTGTGAAVSVTGVGFAPDLYLTSNRNTSGFGNYIADRLRGSNLALEPRSAGAEITATDMVTSFGTSGVVLGSDATGYGINQPSQTYIDWFFRRAPGFFDIVCYKGTGAVQTLAHNLGDSPGMMWIKDRTSSSANWRVYHSALGATQGANLNLIGVTGANPGLLNNTTPGPTSFTVGTDAYANTSGDNYVAYLFGALPGVSSIGSYSGNGATQTINCGFASGARFVLIKRTDATGDWIVLDTVRGIIVGNDPYLLLDSTAAENTTTDLLTPQSVGFGLTSNALVNTNGGTYIYLAIA